MNLLAYAQQLEDEADAASLLRSDEVAEARAVAAKLREAVSLVNEMAKLVIRYQGLLDRRETADAADLRSVLGDLSSRLALDAVAFAEIVVAPKPEESPSELAARMRRSNHAESAASVVFDTQAGAVAKDRGAASPPREPAIHPMQRLTHEEANAMLLKRAPRDHASVNKWGAESWMIDALVEASTHAPPRIPLTRSQAFELGRKYADPVPSLVPSWAIDAIIEASR